MIMTMCPGRQKDLMRMRKNQRLKRNRPNLLKVSGRIRGCWKVGINLGQKSMKIPELLLLIKCIVI